MHLPVPIPKSKVIKIQHSINITCEVFPIRTSVSQNGFYLSPRQSSSIINIFKQFILYRDHKNRLGHIKRTINLSLPTPIEKNAISVTKNTALYLKRKKKVFLSFLAKSLLQVSL